MMNIFLLVVLLAICEGQSTTKHKSLPAGCSSFTDQKFHQELETLKEELLRTNAKLDSMGKAHQSQHGRFL